jgi:alpha-ketoglutarate-dependent taurine dioxygenase
MAIYSINRDTCDKADLVAFGRQLGLRRLDGNLCADEDKITSLQVVETGRHKTYIPYTNKRLSWHTDGYYNPPERQIRGMLLHCVENAAEGGVNQLLDHEWAYIHLRDQNPAYISALMHPQAMTIPPNTAEGDELRGEQTGPVFSVMPDNQSLHMRYSARTRNVAWREDTVTQEAQACLTEFLASNSPYIIQYRLQPGEGVITNNVLHNRTAFKDEAQGKHRLLYRARYYDRIAGTELNRFFTE